MWRSARGKVEHEGCRVGNHCDGPLEAAHIVARQYDDDEEVNPLDVVPLCRRHHLLYDAHQLDLLPHLTRSEQARAVYHLGIVSAHRRLSSRDPIV